MSIITLSRGTYSGGTALARCLSGLLGYRVVDRETIIANASSCGASEEKLREAVERPPGLLDRFSEEKSRYMVLFQACLAEEARRDDLVYLGNAGHFMLHGVSHVLRVRIIAPMAYRIAAVREGLSMSGEEAQAYIARKDEERARWTRFLYGVDWRDPALYDLVINLECTSIEEAGATVGAMVRCASFQTTAESRAAMEDLALASRIRGKLMLHAETSALSLDVDARNGVVTLRGKVRDRRQWMAVEGTVRQAPGVESLITDQLVRALDR